MIICLVLKLEISYNRVIISLRIFVSFRDFFFEKDYITIFCFQRPEPAGGGY
jgi:hypothetical protein